MHVLLGFSSVLLVVVGSFLALRILRRLNDWSERRELQLLVLTAPLLSLGLGLVGLHHFANRVCFLGAPSWDYTLSTALPIGMGVVALGGVGWGVLRLLLLERVLLRRGKIVVPELQALANDLAQRLATRQPRIVLAVSDRPMALTLGLSCPTIILSTWMIRRLDCRELEAVLAHELAHIARRDYLVVWLATMLRDAFFYLPTSRTAHRQLQREKELACDDLAVAVTRRPLSLASALAKVWQRSLGEPVLNAAQSLVGNGVLIEHRIERLLDGHTSCENASHRKTGRRLVAISFGGGGLAALVALQAVAIVLMLTPMGCGPSLLGTLL